MWADHCEMSKRAASLAAAELRRLHDELISSNTHAELTDLDCIRLEAEIAALKEENERLHQINQSHEMKLSVRGYENQIADLKAEVEELRGALDEAMWHVKYKELKAVNESDTALLRQCLEALEQFAGTKLVRTSNVITALRERLGEKT
jgi:uncharacterized protein YqfA (UPF0365 family)